METGTEFSFGPALNIAVNAVRSFGILSSAIILSVFKSLLDLGDVEKAFGKLFSTKAKDQCAFGRSATNHWFANREAEQISPDTWRATVIGDHFIDIDIRLRH